MQRMKNTSAATLPVPNPPSAGTVELSDVLRRIGQERTKASGEREAERRVAAEEDYEHYDTFMARYQRRAAVNGSND